MVFKINYRIFICWILIFNFKLKSQIDSNFSLAFDFNEHKIIEKDNKLSIKPVGVSLTYDRFGNKESAVYIHGHNSSYLNLGTSKLLKSPVVTISLWINLERRVYAGKGFDANPILGTRNGPGEDFICAYAIAYECYNNKLAINSTKDSTKEVTIHANNNFEFNAWHHLVYVCNNQFLAFYIDGELQGKASKNFETKFLNTDSVVLGHSASIKNERFTLGVFDDIYIFHRVLNENEIKELYKAPNPNRFQNILLNSIKYIFVILIIIGVVIYFRRKQRISLLKQKEQLQLINKISELELKVVKAQINPHFISNSLVAIQELIYSNQIDSAGQYLSKFSFYLRQILTYSNENFISIHNEIELIKLYVEFEQLRFKNQLVFNIEILPEININKVAIPALITQPFLENAIWHGLKPLNDKTEKQLSIYITKKNNLYCIEIIDNGVGRDSYGKNTEKSMGTKLIKDKMLSLNKLYEINTFELEIIDLIDEFNNPKGTSVKIYFESIVE